MAAYPYNKPIVPTEIQVLMVCMHEDVKNKVSSEMINYNNRKYPYGPSIRMHGVNSLPNEYVSFINTDYVIFMVDLQDKKSRNTIRESLHHIDASFFIMGKSCILVFNKAGQLNQYDKIIQLSKLWRCPILNFELNGEWNHIERNLSKLIFSALGITPGVRLAVMQEHLKLHFVDEIGQNTSSNLSNNDEAL